MQQSELKAQLSYDPGTGEFTWATSRRGVRKGTKAGTTCARGYVHIKLAYFPYLAHRLAFLWMTGRWPSEIDHINRDPSDNRWSNLREVTSSLNALNRTNKRGISLLKSGRYKARAMCNGDEYFLGHHDTYEQALAARQAWEARHAAD